jgi:hypothetical protein
MNQPIDDAPQFLEANPLAKDRVEQIEKDIETWARKPIEFSFDPSGTNLFSIEELVRAFAKRAADFSKSIRALLANDQVIPATVVGRALIETVGMACLFMHDMNRLVAAGDRRRLDARFEKYYVGIKGRGVEPVHVMDAIRHLTKIDAEYVEYLDSKHGMFAVAKKIAKAPGYDLTKEEFSEALSVMKNYDLLSEVSHPNGIGTQFMYGQPGNIDDKVLAARRRFHQASLMAIWSCHHMLVSLDASTDFAASYRTAFMVAKQ